MSIPIGPPGRDDAPKPPNDAPRPQDNPWALRIATLAGIPIRLHFTFLLFLVYVGVQARGGRGPSLALVGTLFLCVVLHELGHSVVALRCGIPVADITLYPIGGVARIEKRPTPLQELGIAVAGPAVNVVIAGVLWVVLLATGPLLPPSVTHSLAGGWRGFAQAVMAVNIVLFLFNLIPALPMDGGRVLRALLALNMPPERATAIAANVGQLLAIAGFVLGLLHGPPMLMLIALFVYIGAGQEVSATRQEALFQGVKVHQAMMTDLRTLAVGSTLREAADVLLDTSQHDFPVLHGQEVQGVLTRDGLLRGLSQEGPSGYVAGAMNRDFAWAGPNDDLADMVPRLQSASGPLVVLDSGKESKLLGIVTAENIREFFAVRQIVAARSGKGRQPNG